MGAVGPIGTTVGTLGGRFDGLIAGVTWIACDDVVGSVVTRAVVDDVSIGGGIATVAGGRVVDDAD
jgi:hypothetical protein